MLIIISPAKTMDTSKKVDVSNTTTPFFKEESLFLAAKMAQFSEEELSKILKISMPLAKSTHKRFKEFGAETTPKIPAILAYSGTVFKEIKVSQFTQEDFNYSQDHLRIISILYGVVRPLDLINAYRMEYNLKLGEEVGSNLYQFWKNKLTKELIKDIQLSGGVLINLGSLDLLPAIDMNQLTDNIEIITPEFKDFRNGKWETIRTYAKVARGSMTNYIIKNRIENSEDLKKFKFKDYSFNPEISTDNNYIFTKNEN